MSDILARNEIGSRVSQGFSSTPRRLMHVSEFCTVLFNLLKCLMFKSFVQLSDSHIYSIASLHILSSCCKTTLLPNEAKDTKASKMAHVSNICAALPFLSIFNLPSVLYPLSICVRRSVSRMFCDG